MNMENTVFVENGIRSYVGVMWDLGLHGEKRTSKPLISLAAPQGFEPRYADPESAVLPLNEGAAAPIWLVKRRLWNHFPRLSDSMGLTDGRQLTRSAALDLLASCAPPIPSHYITSITSEEWNTHA